MRWNPHFRWKGVRVWSAAAVRQEHQGAGAGRPPSPCAKRLGELSKGVKSIAKQVNGLGNKFKASLTASYRSKYAKQVKSILTGRA
jgi:hypothetical protein